MPTSDLSTEALQSLVGTRHATTGIEFPPVGLQPYHDWLIQTLHRLAESSAGALRVSRADDDATVHVAPGRASIDDVALQLPETTLNLAAFNNSTALIWLADDSGSATVLAADTGTGWPGTAHLKLAEVTLASGVVTAVLDRRFETVFRV